MDSEFPPRLDTANGRILYLAVIKHKRLFDFLFVNRLLSIRG